MAKEVIVGEFEYTPVSGASRLVAVCRFATMEAAHSYFRGRERPNDYRYWHELEIGY